MSQVTLDPREILVGKSFGPIDNDDSKRDVDVPERSENRLPRALREATFWWAGSIECLSSLAASPGN
jgi:hypothetical protein